MADEEQRPDDVPGDEVPTGSEANASGPAPHDELTVEDILSAEQSDAATGADNDEDQAARAATAADATTEADEAAGSSPEEDTENPYLEDLRRITAEYANYRKRTEANVDIEKARAKAAALMPLLTVLDDLDRAEAHGDLEEGSAFTTIAQKIRGTLERMGLEAFGEKDEPFDPQVHEAIAQVPVPGTQEPTVLDVVERGYRIGDVELRPAKVAVAVAADG